MNKNKKCIRIFLKKQIIATFVKIPNMAEADNNNLQVNESKDDSQGRRESTRSLIALIYVACFFGAILFVFGIGLLFNYTPDDYKDLLVAVSGILSGPLGFIVGYYFKASKE